MSTSAIEFNFVANRLLWPIRRAVEETGQRVTYVSIDNAAYNPATGKTGGKRTEHTGKMGLGNWSRAADGTMRRRGMIEPKDLDPVLERAPRVGDLCTALDGQDMRVVAASATVYRDVILAWTLDFQAGTR